MGSWYSSTCGLGGLCVHIIICPWGTLYVLSGLAFDTLLGVLSLMLIGDWGLWQSSEAAGARNVLSWPCLLWL